MAIDSNGIELLLVCGIGDRNWILDGIAKKLDRDQNLNGQYYAPKNPELLPKSKHVMFMHQTILKIYTERFNSNGTKAYCWYTHPRDETEEELNSKKNVLRSVKSFLLAHRTETCGQKGIGEDISKVV